MDEFNSVPKTAFESLVAPEWSGGFPHVVQDNVEDRKAMDQLARSHANSAAMRAAIEQAVRTGRGAVRCGVSLEHEDCENWFSEGDDE